MLVHLLVLPVFFFLLLLLLHHNSQRSSGRHPPGPKGLPIIGNIHQVDLPNLHIWLTKLSKTYGPIFLYKICRVPVVVISSADAAKKALKDNDIAFAGRPYSSASLRISYDHSDIITSPYSDYWKNMRKMVVQHLFSPQKIRSFRRVREDEVRCMISGILNKAKSNEVVDVGEAVSSFNSNVLCRVAFGKKLGMQFEKNASLILAYAFLIYGADCIVYGWINKLLGLARRVEIIFKEMDSFYQQIIDEHLQPDRPESMANDILDFLIQLRADQSAPLKIDWKHIKAIVMNIFVAGTDTTKMSLIWAMTALIKNPNAMKKVQEEVRSLVGKKELVDEDDVEKLPYLKAVVKETMRLYPTVPIAPRETTKAVIVDGYEIEAKTLVLVNIWGISRDPDSWENADEFMPERFLNENFDFKGQQLGFIPFGSGRRICPGATLGVANMELALANLVYFFNWEIPNGQHIDTDATVGLVLNKKNPLYLLPKTYI